MTKRMISSLILATGLMFVGLAWSRSASASGPCTVADIRGTYAVSFTVISNIPAPQYDAFAFLWTFDGAGNLSGRGFGMENGVFVGGGGGGALGTYEVASDCGGALHLTIGGTASEAVFFASNRTERLHFLLLDAGTAGAGFADKQ